MFCGDNLVVFCWILYIFYNFATESTIVMTSLSAYIKLHHDILSLLTRCVMETENPSIYNVGGVKSLLLNSYNRIIFVLTYIGDNDEFVSGYSCFVWDKS